MSRALLAHSAAASDLTLGIFHLLFDLWAEWPQGVERQGTNPSQLWLDPKTEYFMLNAVCQ